MKSRLIKIALLDVMVLAVFLAFTGCPLDKPPAPPVHNYAGIEFVWCVPGSFMMGGSATDPDAANDEFPQHEVTFTQGFWI